MTPDDYTYSEEVMDGDLYFFKKGLDDLTKGKLPIVSKSHAHRLFLVAVHFNNASAIIVVLDWYNVPSENLTLQERISYYQLTME